MRIAGQIEHPRLKITILEMNNRFSVKFEDQLLEQTYKFRSGPHLQSPADVRRLVDAEFINAVLRQMEQMHYLQAKTLERFNNHQEDQFDEII